MKKLSIIAAIAALVFFGMACTEKDPIGGNTSNYPEINTFVETHFPQTSIQQTKVDNDEIEVKLADRTEIDFTLNFEWKNIDCEDSQIYGSVPTELVPTQITDYVTANYPNNHIDKIEKKQAVRSNGWEIELDNNVEINFDNEFNVVTNGGNTSDYPEINTFVETYFPQATILKMETDDNEIEVKLTDRTEIDFTLNFEWKNIDCEDSQIYGVVPTELVPTQITDYVTANYPNNHIDQIEKKHNGGWEIELDNDIEIEFDSEFNMINGGGNGGGVTPDYPEINTFVETYFPQTTILKVEADDDEIEVELADKTEINFYLNNDWKSIDCEDSQIYGIVPAELVPTQITDYVTANYPDNHIDKIEKKHNGGWEIELDNDFEIEFDSEFNVINGGGNGGGVTPDYPEISTFVETYFPQTTILKVEADDDEIEVELADKTDITFYLNNDWKSIDCEDSQIYGIVPAELVPTQITDYVTANYPNNHIDKIEKKHNGGWEIELDNGIEIEFDQNFNVIEVGDK